MRLVLSTWNGHAINDWTPNSGGNFSALYEVGQRINIQSSPIFVKRAQNFPLLAASVPADHHFTFRVICRGTSIPTQRDTLLGYFNMLDFQQHQLVAIDTDNGNKQWYLQGFVERVVDDKIGVLLITIALYDPTWRSVTLNSDTWNLTASGQNHNISIGGNLFTKPIFTITPTASRTGGYQYKRWYPLYNQATTPIPFAVSSRDITEGGINTSTLVSGGKMLASGNDLRVLMDGVEIDRWLDGINTSSTKVWCNIPLSPKQEAILLTGIAGSGAITTITLQNTSASKAMALALANAVNKVLLIDNEAFTFTGVLITATAIQFTGVTRAAKGTSMGAHTANTAVVRWIEHDIWMIYGNSAALAPDTNDNNKPLLDLHNSTNTGPVWLNFFDTTAQRPWAWNGQVTSSIGKQDNIYTGDTSGDTSIPPVPIYANPATEMGMQAQNYLSGGVYKPETCLLAWYFTHPAGFTAVTVSGKKRTSNTTVWAKTAVGLQKLQIGSSTNWLTVFNEAVPASTAWAALSVNGVNKTLGATYNSIRFALIGSVSLANALAAVDVQFDTLSGTLDNTKTPVGALNAEQTSYYFSFKLTNTVSGEYINFTYPGALNQAVVIDCNARTCVLADGTNVIGALQFSSIRQDWLNIDPTQNSGVLNLQFDDTGIGNTTIQTQWNDRSW